MEFDPFGTSSVRQAHFDLPDDAAAAAPNPAAQGDIEALLRSKRKRRSQKVCQPCRLRKVKCTYETPCNSCVERGHPELCVYDPDPPAAKRVFADKAGGEDSHGHLPSKEEWDEMRQKLANVDQMLREMRDNIGLLRADLSSG